MSTAKKRKENYPKSQKQVDEKDLTNVKETKKVIGIVKCSATGEDGGNRNRGAGRMNSLSSYPDSHQVLLFFPPYYLKKFVKSFKNMN